MSHVESFARLVAAIFGSFFVANVSSVVWKVCLDGVFEVCSHRRVIKGYKGLLHKTSTGNFLKRTIPFLVATSALADKIVLSYIFLSVETGCRL